MAKRSCNRNPVLSVKMAKLLLFAACVCFFCGMTVKFTATIRIDAHKASNGQGGQIEAKAGNGYNIHDTSFYEHSLKKFQDSEEGAQLFAELSALDNVTESPLFNKNFADDGDDDNDNGDDSDGNGMGDPDTEDIKPTRLLLKQYKEYAVDHPKIVALIPKLKDAVEKVFGYSKQSSQKNYPGNENGSDSGSASDVQTKQKTDTKKTDAIVLENILQVLKHLPEDEAEQVMHDKKLLAEKLIRSDLEMSEKEFRETHHSLKLDQDMTFSTEVPSFFRTNSAKNASFLNIKDGVARRDACHLDAEHCDRRDLAGSCEKLLRVEDQRSCGSCWAFAGSHYLALAHCIASGRAVNFSEQEIIDCSGRECSGGSFVDIYKYLAKERHLASGSDYSYEARRGVCKARSKRNTWTGDFGTETEIWNGSVNKSSLRLSDEAWIKKIKETIVEHGSALWYLNANSLRFNPGFAEVCDHPGQLNYAAVITGWTEINGRRMWIARNSWGLWWGKKGYAYVAMDRRCGREMDPIAALQLVHVGKWLDENQGGSVIDEQPDNNNNNLEKQVGIPKGFSAALSCASGLINVKTTKVIKLENGYAYEQPSPIDVSRLCNSRASCYVHHVHGGIPGYDTLKIIYECTTGGNPSPNPSPSVSPQPSPAQPHGIDCDKAKGVPGKEHWSHWCVINCKAVLPRCTSRTDTFNCLKEHLLGSCDLSNTTNGRSPVPTTAPTYAPTYAPTHAPTYAPTYAPTSRPTYAPTHAPTYAPTHAPTYAPTSRPTYAPTPAPAPAGDPCSRARSVSGTSGGWCMKACDYHYDYCTGYPSGIVACLRTVIPNDVCDVSRV